MFKFLVVAALVTVVVGQVPFSPFNRLGSPFGGGAGLFNPYNQYYGNNYNRFGGLGGVNGLGLGLGGVNGIGLGLGGVNGLGLGLGGVNGLGLGGLGNYYNRGAFLGGDYYNRGLIGGRGPLNGFGGFPAVRPPIVAPLRSSVGGAEAGARIVSQSHDATPDGAYQYQYQTENGIAAAEQNIPRLNPNTGEVVNTVQGTYSYTAPTGEQIAVSYVADENGFQPQVQDGSVAGPVSRLGQVAPLSPLASRGLPAPLRARVAKRN